MIDIFQVFVLLAATLIFIPSFLLAIISTLDLFNKKSLSILISHPYLVLLPTFTYFSFSKLQTGDRRISISPVLTLMNILLINGVVEHGIFFLAIHLSGESFNLHYWSFFTLYLVSIALTLLFLKIEEISCCFWCGSPGRLVRVFDPDHPEKSLIIKQGRVVEVTDVEQGEHSEVTALVEEPEDLF